MKITLCIVGGVLLVWVVGDFLYSRIVASRAENWESSVKRNEAGVRIGCEEYSAGQGDTAFLLVHGINESPVVYRKMAPKIIAAGNHIRATRLPGFAKPLAEYAAVDRSQWIAQISSDVADLRKDHKRVVLVAHSLGGAVAMQYLLSTAESGVDAVVLLAPAIEVSSARSPIASTRFWHELSNYTLLFTRITESPFAYDARDPAVRENPFTSPYAPRSVVNQTFALIDANRGQAAKNKIPVLIILGKYDQVVDNKAAKEWFEQVAAKRKKLVVLPEAAHAIPLDFGWEEATDEILKFAQD